MFLFNEKKKIFFLHEEHRFEGKNWWSQTTGQTKSVGCNEIYMLWPDINQIRLYELNKAVIGLTAVQWMRWGASSGTGWRGCRVWPLGGWGRGADVRDSFHNCGYWWNRWTKGRAWATRKCGGGDGSVDGDKQRK